MQSKAQIQLAPHGEDRSGLPKSFRSGSESSSFTPGRPTQHTIIGTSSISSYNRSTIAALKLGAGLRSETAVRRLVGWRFERKFRLKMEPRLGVESAPPQTHSERLAIALSAYWAGVPIRWHPLTSLSPHPLARRELHFARNALAPSCTIFPEKVGGGD